MEYVDDIDNIEEKRICFTCVGEKYLKNQIKIHGDFSCCSYCGNKENCYTIKQMSEIISNAFSTHFIRTSDEPDSMQYMMMKDRESDYNWCREGDPVVDAIAGAADIPEAAALDIQSILEEEHGDIDYNRMGEETEFSSDTYYEQKTLDDRVVARRMERIRTVFKDRSSIF